MQGRARLLVIAATQHGLCLIVCHLAAAWVQLQRGHPHLVSLAVKCILAIAISRLSNRVVVSLGVDTDRCWWLNLRNMNSDCLSVSNSHGTQCVGLFSIDYASPMVYCIHAVLARTELRKAESSYCWDVAMSHLVVLKPTIAIQQARPDPRVHAQEGSRT